MRLTFGTPPSFTSSLPTSNVRTAGRQKAANNVAIVLIPAVPIKKSTVMPNTMPSTNSRAPAISIGNRMRNAI